MLEQQLDKLWCGFASLALFSLIFTMTGHASIRSESDIAGLPQENVQLIDVRDQQSCLDDGINMALCLPASTIKTESGEIPSFYHINWLLGTAGLDGSETLLVFSDNEFDLYLVSGVLHLAGQQEIILWSGKPGQLQQIYGAGSGRVRGNTRHSIFAARMRDELITMPSQLTTLKTQGWELVTSENAVSNATNPIIANVSPGVAIATFAQLLTMNRNDATVMINSFAGKAFMDYSPFQIIGLLLMAVGVAAWLFSVKPGKKV